MKNKLLYDNYLLHQVHELVMQVAFFSLLILRNLHQTYRKKKIINYCSLLLEKCCGLVVAKLATEPAAKMLRSSFQKHTTSYLGLHIRILKATLQNKFKNGRLKYGRKNQHIVEFWLLCSLHEAMKMTLRASKPFSSQDLISNSPHCLPYSSCNVSLENLDQLITA